MLRSRTTTCRGFALALSLAATAAAAADPPSPDAIAGSWARRAGDCAAPALSFAADHATVRLDADGTPTSFEYPGVRYTVADARVTVVMGRRHPFSKTPSGTELSFAFNDDGSIAMQRKAPAAPVRFVRCR